MNMEIKKTIKNEKGFTLVELIVVIAILAILAAVAVPNYVQYQYRAMVNTDISTAAEVVRAARMYEIETGNTATETTTALQEDLPVLGGTAAYASGTNAGIKLSGGGADAYVATLTIGDKAGGFKGKTATITENQPVPKATGKDTII